MYVITSTQKTHRAFGRYLDRNKQGYSSRLEDAYIFQTAEIARPYLCMGETVKSLRVILGLPSDEKTDETPANDAGQRETSG